MRNSVLIFHYEYGIQFFTSIPSSTISIDLVGYEYVHRGSQKLNFQMGWRCIVSICSLEYDHLACDVLFIC
jgi:hypothetical protein